MPTKVIIITAGTQITLPSDWNPSNNSIEVIGGGQGGGRRTATVGGIGGVGAGYSKISNFGSPNQSLTINVGAGGSGANTANTAGGNTWVSNTGSAPTSTAQGVLANGGGSTTTRVGTTTYQGGGGGNAYNSSTNDNGGGGGGAGGPTGMGNPGTTATSTNVATGGSGSAGAGGAGASTSGGIGGTGSQWTATTTAISGTGLAVAAVGAVAGAGGGGGGQRGVNQTAGGTGGQYGGGGGGGCYYSVDLSAFNGGSGRQGVIVLTYTTAAIPSTGPVSMSDLQNTFGGSNPISLSEYYAGGGLVPAGSSGINGAIPSSGTISLSQFRGAG